MQRARISLVLLAFSCAVAVAEERVPEYLIRLPESVKTVFVAETTSARFYRFENAGEAGIRHAGDSYMSIGSNGDHKQRSGDRKTPLGIYFVTEQLNTERMAERYGYTAFVLDYPNALDRLRQRTGSGIWVHGVDRRGGRRPPQDTDGCIALPNDELAALEKHFEPNLTPVLVARTVEWGTAARLTELRNELSAAVEVWAESQQSGDLYTFLSLYDASFRHWGMNNEEWAALQVQTLPARKIQSVTVSELLLLGDPVENNTYLSRFRLQSVEGDNTVTLTKRLYWRRGDDGKLRLIAEDSG